MTSRRRRQRTPTGYFHLESVHHRELSGFGDESYVRLRDEFGTVWTGSGEVDEGGTIRYRFSDGQGRSINGIGDANGITLRDNTGRTWRGYVY